MQPGMGSFVFRTQNVTDKAKDDQHNAELCKWLVSSAIAFNTVDDPSFVQYIGGLSPGHKVAGAHHARGCKPDAALHMPLLSNQGITRQLILAATA